MKKRKIIFSTLIIGILLLSQTLSAWGAEWYELHEVIDNSETEMTLEEDFEVMPNSRYILGAKVIVKRPSSDVIMMRSEVYCTETMKTISTVFTLQKKVGNSWVNVGQGTVSTSNSNSMYKSMEATGVSAGTYRCVADTRVTSKTGYSESVSVTSGEI